MKTEQTTPLPAIPPFAEVTGSVKIMRMNATRSDSAPKVQAETATAETRQGRGNRLGGTISPNAPGKRLPGQPKT